MVDAVIAALEHRPERFCAVDAGQVVDVLADCCASRCAGSVCRDTPPLRPCRTRSRGPPRRAAKSCSVDRCVFGTTSATISPVTRSRAATTGVLPRDHVRPAAFLSECLFRSLPPKYASSISTGPSNGAVWWENVSRIRCARWPSRLLRDVQVAVQLHGATALEIGGHQVHRVRPHPKPEVDPAMSVLVRTEKYLRHSRFRHQYGCGLRFLPLDHVVRPAVRAGHAARPAVLGEPRLGGSVVREQLAELHQLIPCRKCSPGPFCRGPYVRASLITGGCYNGSPGRSSGFCRKV